MSNLAAVLVGFGVGLIIVVAILWFQRDAVRLGLRQRRAELFGDEGLIEDASGPSSSIQSPERVGTLGHRRLTVVVCFLAALGSAFVAIQTSDETTRVVNVALCAILAIGGGMLLFGRR
ncbi:MAG: hypothetical protein ACM3N0_01285 [Chloroflexota bacterium]